MVFLLCDISEYKAQYIKMSVHSQSIFYLSQGGDLAAVIGKGQVGYPKRDHITGLIGDNHLPTTDATREVCSAH